MRDIFLITSVINTGVERWSYTDVRSIYSPKERFEQTLKTIESIRNLNDNTLIMLVECSDISSDMEDILRSKVDIFINCIDNEEARNACLYSNKKGYGEVVKIYLALNYILKNNIEFDRFFKISGRYVLNDMFDKINYSFDKYTFGVLGILYNYVPSTLYSVPHILLMEYHNILVECMNIYKNNVTSLEVLLGSMCIPKHIIKNVGVSGYCAVDNTFSYYCA